MHIPYKVVPIDRPVPGFPNEPFYWFPILVVKIIVNHAPTKRFEAFVDSGSGSCLFHSDIGRAVGLKVENGEEGPLRGVIGGAKGKVYYHRIKLVVTDQMLSIVAGFSDELSVAGILGRYGFSTTLSLRLIHRLIRPEWTSKEYTARS